MGNIELIFGEISKERKNQNKKWGEQDHPCLNQNVLKYFKEDQGLPFKMCQSYLIPEESVAKRKCDFAAERGELTYAHIAVEELSEVVSSINEQDRRKELIQLGAVVVAWIEKIDRNAGNN